MIQKKNIGPGIKDVGCAICQKKDCVLRAISIFKKDIRKVKRLRAIYAHLGGVHPKCKGCGIMLGGFHVDDPIKTSQGNMCSTCARRGPKKKRKRNV